MFPVQPVPEDRRDEVETETAHDSDDGQFNQSDAHGVNFSGASLQIITRQAFATGTSVQPGQTPAGPPADAEFVTALHRSDRFTAKNTLGGIRTPNPRFRRPVLYPLSYECNIQSGKCYQQRLPPRSEASRRFLF